MGKDSLDGSVYVFINARHNWVKLLHMEPGGLVLYIKFLERGERYTGKRKIDYSGLDVVENVIVHQEVLDAPEDFASMEKLLPGEWKKTHPESHSMVHHTTEAEHVAAILQMQDKEKGIRRGGFQRGIKVIPGLGQFSQTSLNFTKLGRLLQTAQSYTGNLQKPICS